ncbi:MAG: hypothetical protein AAF235_11025 [Planctomycetota bacterium]
MNRPRLKARLKARLDKESLVSVRSPARRRGACVVFLLAAAAMCSAPGCYKRVVRAEGIGTEGITVYEPSVGRGSGGALDGVGDIIFGPTQTQRR